MAGWGIGPACSTHLVALSGSSDQENPGKNICGRHYVGLKMSGNIGTSGYLTSVSRAIFQVKTQGNPDKIKDILNPRLYVHRILRIGSKKRIREYLSLTIDMDDMQAVLH